MAKVAKYEKKSKRRQGHWCWVCRRYRANEKFTGKGHAKHICKDCEQKQRRLKRFQKGDRVLVLHRRGKFEAVVHKILIDKGEMLLKVHLFGRETNVVVNPLKVQKVAKITNS